MSIERELMKRCNSVCELCGSDNELVRYEIPPVNSRIADKAIMVCGICKSQIENPETVDVNHWRCLNESMWSEVPAVQIMAWRLLNRLKSESWTHDLLDMLFLDDELLEWARADGDGVDDNVVHLDSNGNVLKSGDTVVLIKDLNVKGGGFTAKRGTAVRNISLVADNPEQIEGKVEGQQIIILTQYVKK